MQHTDQRPLFPRRVFMKGLAGALAVGALSHVSSALAAENGGKNILILYFSHSGNTRALAEHIHSRVGGDIIELKPAAPYTEDYDALVDLAKREQQENARPELATEIPDLAKYDTVFLGFPSWWGTMPMLFFTLLEKHPLDQKNVIPFCTHGGSRFGHSLEDLRKLCPNARLLEGFEVRGNRVSRAQADADAWLKKLGLLA